jgi:hypothetical protein
MTSLDARARHQDIDIMAIIENPPRQPSDIRV